MPAPKWVIRSRRDIGVASELMRLLLEQVRRAASECPTLPVPCARHLKMKLREGLLLFLRLPVITLMSELVEVNFQGMILSRAASATFRSCHRLISFQ